MNLIGLVDGRWLLEGLTDAPIVMSDQHLNDLAMLTGFRFDGSLERNAWGGLELTNGFNSIHVAFSDEADELLDQLRAESKLDPPDCLDDGFGGVEIKCGRLDCGLEIVRPGSTQCEHESCPRKG